MAGRLAAAVIGVAALLGVACGGDDGNSSSKTCIDLWATAQTCYDEYCNTKGHNALFCGCYLDQRASLDGNTCACTGSAEASFLDACNRADPADLAAFNCESEYARLNKKSEQFGCCKDSSDCAGGKRCTESHCE